MTPKYWSSLAYQIYAILCAVGIFPRHVLSENKVLAIWLRKEFPHLTKSFGTDLSFFLDAFIWVNRSYANEFMEVIYNYER